jgi:hypothetical protein
MGGTIPMLTQSLSRGAHDATRLHALVYSFNTAGALLAGFLLAIYTRLDEAPYWIHILRTQLGASDTDFYAYHLAGGAAFIAVAGLPLACSGATLPLLFHHMRREKASSDCLKAECGPSGWARRVSSSVDVGQSFARGTESAAHCLIRGQTRQVVAGEIQTPT